MEPPTVGLVLLHQFIIKAPPPDMPTGQSNLGLSSDSMLGQTDI